MLSQYAKCSKCSAQCLREGDKFCRQCGCTAVLDQLEQMVCAVCGKVVEPADQYCFNCGGKTRLREMVEKYGD